MGLRDKHRVVAGDFNLEPHAIRDAVDCVIEQFEGASYEVLHGDRSAEICCVLLNFAKLPQLRGAVKSAVAERWTSQELRLSENDADTHYPLILQLSPLELREGDLRKRSAEAAAWENWICFPASSVTEYTHIITGQIHPAAAACVAARWTRNMGVFLSS